ncbi:hypothetical protein [Clostridium sp.]|uniref:hypothetical protein n=1 Tax=Clostridium sp. TaxID=1506 RepID=UPI0025B85316|nr:hypothetical protein [Clostridium sp.]MBS4955922.1 hypothetical protein [Clostridium sp.]MDU4882077.1 hypothetical protein [Clostridium celatum]MDU7075327.1 hypothetical protein [Clostridium celatum]
MRKFISNIILIVMVMFNLTMIMCSSSNISQNDIDEMKEVVDKVLSYDGDYDEEVSDYIDSQTFNESNYVVFYSYYIGSVVLNKYESEVMGVTKENGKYNLCLLIDMEAQATTLESDGVEEGYDTAEGNDVPVEVVLTKNEGKFYIESVKEYDSLKIAQNENKNFIKNN